MNQKYISFLWRKRFSFIESQTHAWKRLNMVLNLLYLRSTAFILYLYTFLTLAVKFKGLYRTPEPLVDLPQSVKALGLWTVAFYLLCIWWELLNLNWPSKFSEWEKLCYPTSRQLLKTFLSTSFGSKTGLPASGDSERQPLCFFYTILKRKKDVKNVLIMYFCVNSTKKRLWWRPFDRVDRQQRRLRT